MSITRKITASATVTALIVAGVTMGGVSGAEAAPSHPASSSHAARGADATRYDQRDVISFLVLGTGPLMKSHSELASRLGIKKQELSDRIVDGVVSLFARADPHLQERVIEPVQSGDPLRAQAGLEALNRDFAAVTKLLKASHGVDADDGSARGAVYTINWAVTVQVGAVVVAVAAAGVVLALAVVLYRPASGATTFDRELAARSVVESF